MNEIEKNFKILRDNILTVAKNNDMLFETSSFSTWNQKLSERSKALREIYLENEAAIHKLRELSQNLDEETAASFYKELDLLKREEIHDSSIMIEFCELLLDYYSDEKFFRERIFLNLNAAYEKMEYFLRMDSNENKDEIKKHLLNVIKYMDMYKDIPSPQSRRSIYVALYNFVGPLPDLIQEWKKDSIYYFNLAMELFNSQEGQMDKDLEMIQNEIHYLKEIMLLDFPSYIDTNPEIQQRYFTTVDTFIDEFIDEPFELNLYSIVKRYCNHEISASEVIQALLEIFDTTYGDGLIYDGSEDSIFEFGNMSDLSCSIFEFLKKTDFSIQRKKEIAYHISKYLLAFIETVTFKDYPSYFDDVSTEIFRELLPYTETMKEKEELLLKLVIKRQPLTYIHSLMVERISTLIVDEILKSDSPLREEFYTFGYRSDIEIRRYISRAAKFHDLGKCLTVGVINQQSRKLTDKEFQYIKLHPEKALVLISKDEDFSPYIDVMLGHHRFYDGTKGYPLSFDNTKSQYKIAIDLITIADCLDAATDILGRNYTTGKSFLVVLSELQAEKGTRYNPNIVDFISASPKLKEDLDSLLTSGRKQVYYEAFKEIATNHRN